MICIKNCWDCTARDESDKARCALFTLIDNINKDKPQVSKKLSKISEPIIDEDDE
jgi:hypothetical protein